MTVPPRFVETPWFTVLMVLAGALALAALYLLRVRHLTARMHAGIGTAGNGDRRLVRQPQHCRERRFENSLDRTCTRLAGPAREVRPVVADVEPEAYKSGHGRSTGRPDRLIIRALRPLSSSWRRVPRIHALHVLTIE